MKFKIKKIHYKLGLKGEIKNNETSIKESRKKKSEIIRIRINLKHQNIIKKSNKQNFSTSFFYI
jgi:hypothetical protein